MRNNWESTEISVRDLEEKIRTGKIAIPTYQRGNVWTTEQREQLIDSIKRGYPFGSLVMYKFDDVNKPMLLLDGLQRSTALFKFVANPSEFFKPDDINDQDIVNVCHIIGIDEPDEAKMTEVKNKIIEWITSLSGADSISNMDEYECARLIANDIQGPNSINANTFEYILDIRNAIKPSFDAYQGVCTSIINRRIPYIEITGEEEDLSTIFFRLNDKGVKLSPEDKFAASWENKPIKIVNDKLEDFINIVCNRYDTIQTAGTKVYGYDHQSFIDNKELDVFEFCFAFGKYITTTYPELFGKQKDINKPESIGFKLLNACLMGNKDTVFKMNKLLFSRFNTDNDINSFVVKVLDVIKYVDDLLAPVLKFKSNKRIGKKTLHTDFQIISIVASIFKMKHIETNDSNEYIFMINNTTNEWDSCNILLRKNLIRRYLIDSLNNDWTAHGDSTLDNILEDNRNEYYLNEIPYSMLLNSLKNWYENYKNNNKEYVEKDVSSPSDTDKIIMNIIYADTLTAFDQLDTSKYDIEHLFTKKLAEKTLARFGGELRLPISSIGNMCLLPQYTNRKKKDKIIYDDTEYTDTIGSTVTIDQLEDKYTFTEKRDLIWANNNNLTMEEVQTKYYKFIDDRFDKICDKLKEKLYPDE